MISIFVVCIVAADGPAAPLGAGSSSGTLTIKIKFRDRHSKS